jgi:hypothetical protein
MAGDKKGLFSFLKKKPSGASGYAGSANKAIPKSVSAFRDMINGGGAGMEGPKFEGGPISGLLNMAGIKPLGYKGREELFNQGQPAGEEARQRAHAQYLKYQANASKDKPEEAGNLALQTLLSGQAAPQDFYGLAGNPAMQAPLSSLQSNFMPYTPPAGTNIMPTTAQQVGTPYSSDGELGFKPLPQFGGNANGLPPKGMSELAYTNWLRNSPVFNIDKASQQGIKMMYDKYRSNPMFQ